MNAKYAVGKTGSIKLSSEFNRAANQIRIQVTDTGCGIPADKLDKVFDPGFTTKGVGVGTGLGLSICYQIVQAHKGEITVESEVNEGTSFLVRFPDGQ